MNPIYREHLTFAENNRVNRLMRLSKRDGDGYIFSGRIDFIVMESILRSLEKYSVPIMDSDMTSISLLKLCKMSDAEIEKHLTNTQ